MALEVYRKKRKFDVTPEPRGRKARDKGNQFVIQKHARRRLHYDFRLELDGVMKSWAVTRGPSLVPGEKRLAVEVEDHPIEYNTFEGTIPQGEYGGGTVHGLGPRHLDAGGRPTPRPQERPSRFLARGREAHGDWHLVRMRGRPGEKRNNWLLIKASDEARAQAKEPDILEEMPNSVVTGRSIEEIAAGQGKKRVWHSNRSVTDNVKAGATRGGKAARAGARAARRADRANARTTAKKAARAKARSARGAALPDFVPPSLATLRTRRRAARAGCTRSSSTATASRRGSITARSSCSPARGSTGPANFQTSRPTSRGLPADTALIDGEIVVENERGVRISRCCRRRSRTASASLRLLCVRSASSRRGGSATLPLIERKAALKQLLDDAANTGAISLQRAFREDGAVSGSRRASMHARRHRVEARGRAVSSRAGPKLHEDQVRHRAGIRGRRLRRRRR